MAIGTQQLYDEASASLQRVQTFDVSELPREADLGAQLNFRAAVANAQLLVDLFKRLSIQALDDFPDGQLQQVRDHANAVYNLFSQILAFSPAQSDPTAARNSLVQHIASAYPGVFSGLHPLIAYSLHRSADFQRLDTEARATMQGVTDQANGLMSQIQSHNTEAARILGEIRKVAAEEGVSQQAAHFRAESEHHKIEAEAWRKRTVNLAWAVGAFAVASLVLHKIPWFKPESAYDAAQLALSKVLAFGVLAYMLILAARNFLSHQHNAIVNRHRQNALMTHRALVEGAADTGARDAIMVHAASCIFAPQPTGYTQGTKDGDVALPRSVVELMSKPAGSSN
jgi:hypothetical protein